MESTLSKKINSFRVSIRKQQIQAYKKSKRRMFSEEDRSDSIQSESTGTSSEQIYWGILEATALQTLLNMDQQVLGNHIQMLIEIVGCKNNQAFMSQFQSLLCVLVEFFQHTYNMYFSHFSEELTKNCIEFDEERERIIKTVTFDKVFSSIEPNNFLKLIALIYYEISPQNLVFIDKTVVMVRQILAYSFIDSSVVSQYHSNIGIYQIQPSNKRINKSTALLILLNITHSQDQRVIEIVYNSNILHCIVDCLEQFGFQMYEKQLIAGIYANCIEYLCERARQENSLQNNSQMQDVHQRQKFFFLDLFQDLVTTQNINIFQKLVFISVNMLNTSRAQTLPCQQYLVQLSYELVLNIVTSTKQQYLQRSEDLFIILSELYDSKNSFSVLIQFLQIILTKYACIYYQGRDVQKNRQNGEQITNSKVRGLQNISKLVKSCEDILTNPNITFQAQQAFFRAILEFWCSQELYCIRPDLLSFVTTALLASYDLSEQILIQHNDIIIQLMNQSCQRESEVQVQLKLLDTYLAKLEHKDAQFQRQVVQKNSHVFEQLTVRLEDYLMRFSKDNEEKYQLTELVLHKMGILIKNAEFL